MIEELAVEFSSKDIGEMVDKFFPMRNEEDGTPHYRSHQRETTIKIIEAFKNGKKFACLNGPVGCGKSAINYTVGMCMGTTVYLTHQKQLQDQMVKELWPEVKMVKGRGSYCCNGATISDERIRCNYSGDHYETCQNTDRKTIFQDSKIIESIRGMIKMYKDNDRIFRMRTGFEVADDIPTVLNRIRKAHPEDIMNPEFFSKFIGCDMRPVECPVRSTRALSQVYQIRILNPDVFYMLNRGQLPYFQSSDLMVIDECHKIENIVERIFGGNIHAEFLQKYFGIDISELYQCKDVSEFTEKFMYLMKTLVLPAKCAAILTTHLWPLMNLKHIGGDTKMSIGTSALLNEFKFASDKLMAKHSFDMKQFIDSVCKGSCDDPVLSDAWVKCREYFLKKCEDNQCDQTFFDFYSMKNYAWYTESIEHLEDVVGLMTIPDSFMFSQCQDNMWTAYEDSEVIRFVKEQMPEYNKANMTSIKLTPINVSGIMNSFFYNKATNIVLSTGTWVDKEGMMKTFGVDLNSVEFISIPTTFEKENRPVFYWKNIQRGRHFYYSRRRKKILCGDILSVYK